MESLPDQQNQINELRARIARLEAAQSQRSRCPGCDGHECDNGCAYPGALTRPDGNSK